MLISLLDAQFRRLHLDSVGLLEAMPPDRLYWKPEPAAGDARVYTCGELLLRSGRTVEQTFGGLTANLWDDPFEWTLPETLQTPQAVLEYFTEVEVTRLRGFTLFKDDADLSREIALAPNEFRLLGELLVDTLTRATRAQGEALAIYALFSDLPANSV